MQVYLSCTADVFVDVVVYRKEALDHVPQSEIVRGQTDSFELQGGLHVMLSNKKYNYFR